MKAAVQLAQSGWLQSRPVVTDWTVPDLAALGALRVVTDLAPVQPETTPTKHEAAIPSLLSVARADSWLNVDALPTYR